MAAGPDSNLRLPPGFKFHPTDEELIVHYLQNKVTSSPLPARIMADIDLYKFNPWELPKLSLFGEDEWYFFSPRDRKYPQGVRPNRMAPSGYWKATGTDKPISSSCEGSKHIGVKKGLVFYSGRSPKGLKTDWIMTEYRLMTKPSRLKGSMRLDDWVLCRIHKKRSMSKSMDDAQEIDYRVKSPNYTLKEENTSPPDSNYNPNNITDELYQNCPVLAYILASHFESSIKSNKDFGYCQGSGSQGKGNLRTIKRKTSEEDQFQYRFQAGYKYEHFPASNVMITNNINSEDQYYGYIFNPNQLDPTIDFREFNEFSHVDPNTYSCEQTTYRSNKIRNGFYSSLE